MINLKIEFNTDIIKKAKSYGIAADNLGSALFVLFALLENRYDLLDEFDDSNTGRRAIILYRQMERKELLEPDVDSKYHYKVSGLGFALVTYIKEQFHKQQGIDLNAAAFLQQALPQEGDFLEFLRSYISIFPNNLQDHEANVANKMQKFQKMFDYDQETILGATKMYIRSQEESPQGHQFTRRSHFFVTKQEKGGTTYDLATWCKKYQESDKNTIDTSFMDIA